WLAIDSLERWRVGPPRARLRAVNGPTLLTVASGAFLAAVAAVALLWAYERLLRSIATHSTFDLLHFSLHPLHAARRCVAFGLVLLHAAIIWMAAAILRTSIISLRTARSPGVFAIRAVAVATGIALVLLAQGLAAAPIPVGPLLLAVAAALLAATVLS